MFVVTCVVRCTGQCRTNASLVIETVHNNGVWPNGPYFVDEALPLSAIQAWQKVQCFVNRFEIMRYSGGVKRNCFFWVPSGIWDR